MKQLLTSRRFLPFALCALFMLVACDFHGPWEYYPEKRDVYTGIYTYGYIPSERPAYVCFSKVYELDETAAENFAFYDSAYVTVKGNFAIRVDDEERVDTTVVLSPLYAKPNCFSRMAHLGVVGESYTL